MSVNDTLYRDVIERWLPKEDRPLLQKQDLWLFVNRKIMYNDKFCALLVDIELHGGTPCLRRYCICHYFTVKDKCHYRRFYK
jgi:hypothetical protein